jgi:DNA-binding IscR family transcriptional regulator
MRSGSGITLRDVFAALERGELFTEHRLPPSASCPVGAHILPVLREATAPAVEALEAELSGTTIADIASAVLARNNEAESARTQPSFGARSRRVNCVTSMVTLVTRVA